MYHSLNQLGFWLTRIVTVMVAVHMVGCASPAHKSEAWPSSLPKEQAYYEQAYRDDTANAAVQGEGDYLKWVKRFYLGWTMYPNGWHWLTDNAVSKTQGIADKREMEALLTAVGVKIGAEWAKNSKHRQVNTSHLMTWGNVLKLATKRGDQIAVTKHIEQDVDDLLAYRLEPDQIDFDRYFNDTPPVVAYEDDSFDL